MQPRILDEVELNLLLGLYHLRYLTQTQIHQLWYADRSVAACRVRLSRLATSLILSRQKCLTTGESVYSIGSAGLRKLRELRAGSFQPTPQLSQLYLPHHLDTNEVFVALTSERPVRWEVLPFAWSGTLQAALHFEESRRDAFGVRRTRRALLRPDSIVTTPTTRVFLELDRSTECIREADDRRSIRRKLRAYATFIFKGPVAQNRTWYAGMFADDKAPRIVFVLARRDRRARDPAGADRRLKSVMGAAREIDARLAAHCVYLDDTAALATLCGTAVGQAAALPSSVDVAKARDRAIQPAEVVALHTFYRLATEALRRQLVNQAIDPHLRTAAHEAKMVLQRLSR